MVTKKATAKKATNKVAKKAAPKKTVKKAAPKKAAKKPAAKKPAAKCVRGLQCSFLHDTQAFAPGNQSHAFAGKPARFYFPK